MAVEKKEVLAKLPPDQKRIMESLDRLTIDDLMLETIKIDEVADEATVRSILAKEVLMQKVYATGDVKYKSEGVGSLSIQTRKSPDRLDRTMLIAKGVDIDLIDECTVPGGESDPFVVLRPAKAPKVT